MEKIIKFAPAYDKRHSDPKKNYGVHGVELKFILKGEEGAVQFVIFTNWMLPNVQKEQDAKLSDHYITALINKQIWDNITKK